MKLRVRVLESERSARRAGVLQSTTVNAIGCMGFMNVGTMLALNSAAGGVGGPMQSASTVTLGFAAFFGVMVFLGFKRVNELDKFEKEIKG